MINEVAWAGTLASAHDEWIELYNPTTPPVDLSGWTLTDGGDINVSLSGSISCRGFYLLERTDDTTIVDIGADRIYTGALRNSGETLWLKDPTGAVVDSANKDGGGWPAGDIASHASMERLGGGDSPGNWRTFTGYGGVGHDAGGNPIAGTPRHPNSSYGPTPTSTAFTPTPEITPFPPLSVLINEVAWAGTRASTSDEWIELHNPGAEEIDLADWTLTDGGDINLTLAGTITAHGFFLLERSDDNVVSDIAADQLYNGVLKNSGETLFLKDPKGTVIDSANRDGGAWPAGRSSSHASMERRGGNDLPSNWGSFTGFRSLGHDASGEPIPGTARGVNSVRFPTPAPTQVPGGVRINEVLIRPHYDWEGEGKASTGDEFIELYNHGESTIFLGGWRLDDILDGGSRPYILPGVTLAPGDYVAFFRSRTHISLNDRGDSVHLLAPNGRIIDQIRYLRVRAYNLSYGRLPDGSAQLFYGLWPTPGGPNVLFVEPGSESLGFSRELSYPYLCPDGGRPIPRFPRAARHPTLVGWWIETGLFICD
ncbi:MAG TPA: lamin tail domain-containing protein [Anaerolineae bacterium]|nr:lamin tail domain-containing protein [Anaerolineae bacterium]